MLSWKLYLSDLEQWRIQITGSHVPIDSRVNWTLPAGDKERLDEDTRDLILSYSKKETFDNEIRQVIAQKHAFACPCQVPSNGKIKRFIVNKKRRRALRDQNVRESIGENDNSEPSTSSAKDMDNATDMDIEEYDKSKTQDEDNVETVQDFTDLDANEVEMSCPEEHTASTSNDNFVYTLVSSNDRSGQLCTVFNDTNSDVSQQTVQANTDQQFTNLDVVKQDQMVPLEIISTSLQNQLGFIPSSSGVQVSAQDLGVMALPVSQSGSLDPGTSGAQQMTVLSQLPGRVISIDQDGQPCYPNFGDILFVCHQDPTIQQ